MSRRKKEEPPPRAKKGSTPERLLLSLPTELLGLTREAAKQDGVTVSEWWRAAAHLALLSRARERNGHDN